MKIGILDALTVGKDIDLSPLSQCGELVIYDLTSPDEVAERVKDLDVIITNKVILGEDNLKGCTNLKMIALLATGYNNIDIEYARKKQIAVANVAGYSTESVAQHTFAMLLHLIEHLGQYDDYVKSKEYADSETFTYIAWPYQELSGKTLGIIGLGAIGKAVARIAKAFGMQVIYYSTSGTNNSASEYRRVSLEELLKESDVVSIHAPYNEQTHELIGYEQMRQMKPSAYLLNLGRGKIVVEEDLARALNEERIAGAGLDVLEKEPIDHHNPLFKVKDKNKLLITPHIAWASVEARKTLIQEVIMNIEAFKKQEHRNRIV
ncbi:MAG: D-2-hydroxyacid dehydrogenase [Cellulosilyticum sp.]|nr:D-2-hydroxyacid dehydrogenase [Cellulosilyticum sp.]